MLKVEKEYKCEKKKKLKPEVWYMEHTSMKPAN